MKHRYNFFIKIIVLIFINLSFWVANGLYAEDKFDEGIDYFINDTIVDKKLGNKIEVLDIFWYNCPHCVRLMPLTKEWLKTKADDVAFIHTPVIGFNTVTYNQAKLYYVLEYLKLTNESHEAIFNAIHLDNKNLDQSDKIADFVNKNFSIPQEKYKKLENSFGIISKIKVAENLQKKLNITGVPTLIVDKKYIVSPSLVSSLAELIEVLDFVIEKAREDRKAKK